MRKKIVLFFISIFFLGGYNFAFAGLVINEILYSPASKQWIEIYNNGGSSIDLTKYKLLDSGAAVNGHGISAVVAGSNMVEPHAFAVVAKVPADFDSSSLTLFKSSLGIKASGDTVILRDSSGNAPDNIVTVASGSAVDGNSLQLINGSWSASAPTPGALNQVSVVDDGGTGDTETGEGDDPSDATDDTGSGTLDDSSTISSDSTERAVKTSSRSSSKNVSGTEYKTKAIITVPKIIFAGIPFELKGEAFGEGGTRLHFGKYYWNFGDGNSKDTKEVGSFQYTYFYPGEYVLSLEYYLTNSHQTPDATAKIAVKAVPMSISISKVGDQKDFFVELSNNTDYEMNISGWILSSSNRAFVLPRNSIILPKKKIMLSSKVTNFSIYDKNTLKLLTSQKELAFDYLPTLAVAPIAIPKSRVSAQISSVKTAATTISLTGIEKGPGGLALTSTSSPLLSQNLGGPEGALESDVIKSDYKNSSLPMFFSIIFIGVAAGAVYLIRQKRIVSDPGDDFNILDE